MITAIDRIAEYRQTTSVQWTDEQIAQTLAGFDERITTLRSGGKIHLRAHMGSCQCGDCFATLWVEDGRVVMTASGQEAWQKFAGLASDCQVKYGIGATAATIAALFEGTPLPGGVYYANL